MAALKKDWILTRPALRGLLDWLDDGSDSRGEKYLEVRRRLRAYFDRKHCVCSDELVDETLNRVARKLEEKGAITEVSALHYCYIVAKFVFLEDMRRAKPVQTDATELLSSRSKSFRHTDAWETEADELSEKMLSCLEKCLSELAADDRELILEYYRGERRAKIERRSELAARLGLSINAVSIRACRIRNKLEACVKVSFGES
jgi:DNA-directed RNA polymerase specialized sigma24 family protein